jgi:hypothetical protein
LASRRRRRKSIGKVIVDVERRVRRVEKRPGAKRLKRNVVTTEKLGYRAVTTKVIQEDAVTANEAAFGVTVVSGTEPIIVKEGTTVVDPASGSQKVWSEILGEFVDVTDPTAQSTADSKSATFYDNDQPAGTAFNIGDMWVDTNDNDKLYVWDGDSWELAQDSASASAAAQAAQDSATAAAGVAAAASAAATAAAATAAAADAAVAAAVAEAESASGVAATAAANAAAAQASAAEANTTAAAASASATSAAAAAGAAQSTATTALANAATAFTAAQNSLQPSASTIVNASNQMTAINGTGITVYSGASATTGARVVLNSAGLAGFNSSSTGPGNGSTFSISASTGEAVFKGNITTGATITGGTMNINGNAIINETGILTATGATITGTINATSGYFGTEAKGWSISETGLVGVNEGTIVGGVISGTQFTNGSTFSVSPTGTLIASNAEITGIIRATSGYFGNITGGTLNGWTISANSIVGSGTGTISGGTISGTQFTNGGTFSVSPTGFLIASNAEITGIIKSNEGYFGSLTNGFLIGATGLTGVGTGAITTTGTVGGYGSNTMTISGGKLSANSVIYLETNISTGVIDLIASKIELEANTEITGTFEASGSTLFNGANNQINRDTDVGGTSTKNIRNVWIRDTLISATSSSGSIGDIWLQYA